MSKEQAKPNLEQLLLERAKLSQVKLWRSHPIEFMRARDIITGRPVVWTSDEHDMEHPLKPFPVSPVAVSIASAWFDTPERTLIIAKSRQIMATWTAMVLHLWLAMFFEGQRIFYLAKHQTSTQELIDRTKTIYRHLPPWLRELFPLAKKLDQLPRSQIVFKHRSSITGVPRGETQLRQYTASAVFIDEAAFIPHFEEVMAAAIPTIAGGGRLMIVSTAMRGTAFEAIAQPKENYQDEIEDSYRVIRQRLAEVESHPASEVSYHG